MDITDRYWYDNREKLIESQYEEDYPGCSYYVNCKESSLLEDCFSRMRLTVSQAELVAEPFYKAAEMAVERALKYACSNLKYLRAFSASTGCLKEAKEYLCSSRNDKYRDAIFEIRLAFNDAADAIYAATNNKAIYSDELRQQAKDIHKLIPDLITT